MNTSHPFDPDEAVRLLQMLVQIDTTNPPGGERKGAELLAQELEGFGLHPKISDLGSGRANVTAVLEGGERPSLIYNGHIDVVPVGEARWRHPPFGGEIHGGKLYGRGSSDMKSGVAAMLVAVGALAKQGKKLGGDLVFSAVADEEFGGLGAERFVSEGGTRGAGAVVFSEPTGFQPYIAEKGVYWVELETIGKTAHGAMPHLGRNAILDMQELLGAVKRVPLPTAPDKRHGSTTMNVGSIQGGVSANVVPDSCKASLDIRIPPGVAIDQVLREYREAARRAEEAAPGMETRITQKAARVPVATTAHERIVRVVLELCEDLLGIRRDAGPTPGYATDASVLCRSGDLPFVIIGPGQEEMAHKPDEYVILEDYLRGIEFYCSLAERYLGFADG